MVSDWPVVSLGDVAADITVGHVGPMASEYQPTGIPFLRSQDIKPYRLKLSGVAHISEVFHAQASEIGIKARRCCNRENGKARHRCIHTGIFTYC